MESPHKIKHLEMIQGVITRMGSNSFKMKGWYITTLSATYAYWLTNKNPLKLGLAFGVITLFWVHDGYYLHLERGFCELYDKVRQQQKETDFIMKPVFHQCKLKHWLKTMKRPVLLLHYGIPAIVTITLWVYFMYLKDLVK